MHTIIIILIVLWAIGCFILTVIYMKDDKKNQEKAEKSIRRYSQQEHKKVWNHKYTLGHEGMRVIAIPFVPKFNEIFYLENEYDEKANEFIRQNIDYIRQLFATRGLTFVYLPEVKVSKERVRAMAEYYNPSGDNDYTAAEEPESLRSDMLLDYMLKPENRKDIKNGFAWFAGVSEHNGLRPKYIVNYITFVGAEALEHPKEVLAEILPELCENNIFGGGLFSTVTIDEEEQRDDPDWNFGNDDLLDDNTKKELQEIKDKLDKVRLQGISEAIISRYTRPYPKLSRMVITSDFRIILPDYKNMEIKMEPLVKAVYIFFLRHPEGVMFKELPEHREELEYIYRAVKSKRNDIDRRVESGQSPVISPSVTALTDPTSNSINEKCTRIKEAFVSHFHEYTAINYFVSGGRFDKKIVRLPHKLITWEDENGEK